MWTVLYSQNSASQKVWLDGDVYVEYFDSTEKHPNRYTSNNHIYKAGTSIKFDYTFIDPQGKTFKFQSNEDKNTPWELVELNKASTNTIAHIRMDVHYAQDPIQSKNPSYDKTTISYTYLNNATSQIVSYNGLVENELNVWLQPPNTDFFGILQLNPFPFIQASYKKGNRWQLSNKVNAAWSNARWKTWEGNLDVSFDYGITGERYIESKIGKLPCYIVEAEGKSKLGKTALKAYFNLDHGFVKLEYFNIDRSQIIFDIVEFNSAE